LRAVLTKYVAIELQLSSHIEQTLILVESKHDNSFPR